MYTEIEKRFEASFIEFATGIFRYIYFKVSEYELAQDLTEETFVRYWKRLKDGKAIDNHKALLYFIAKGLVVDHYRIKKYSKKQSLETVDERLLAVSDNYEDALAQKQELEQVYTKINKLKKEYQDVLFLHYVEDLSIKEIAFIQKKQENAVRVLLHRALRQLKENL